MAFVCANRGPHGSGTVRLINLLDPRIEKIPGTTIDRSIDRLAVLIHVQLKTCTKQVAHLKYGKLAIGHYRDDPEELARVAQLWDGAKIEVETAPSLLKARWQKLCWNVPFNGIGVVLGADFGWVVAAVPFQHP